MLNISRLDTKTSSTKETLNKFYSGIDDEDFAFALIQELVHSFLAADECSIQVNLFHLLLLIIAIIDQTSLEFDYFFVN